MIGLNLYGEVNSFISLESYCAIIANHCFRDPVSNFKAAMTLDEFVVVSLMTSG